MWKIMLKLFTYNIWGWMKISTETSLLWPCETNVMKLHRIEIHRYVFNVKKNDKFFKCETSGYLEQESNFSPLTPYVWHHMWKTRVLYWTNTRVKSGWLESPGLSENQLVSQGALLYLATIRGVALTLRVENERWQQNKFKKKIKSKNQSQREGW